MTLDASIAAREPLPEHRELYAAFLEEARRRLAFLTEHGWAEHDARWPLLEYRTPATRLVVWLRPAADGEHLLAEGMFDAASTPDTEHLLPLLELYRRAHPDATRDQLNLVRAFPANDRAQIARALERIAGLLREEGRELVEDRPGLVDDVRGARAASSRDRELSERRPAVDAAFKAEDWATVIRELEPFEDRLHPSERMKLDYARKHR